MTNPAPGAPRAHVVAAILREAGRVLLCHRSPRRRWYPDVWDLPGGHVEPGEPPAAALARELREELGIAVALPVGPPVREVGGATFEMGIWLVEAWTGAPVNAAPEEHDAIAWFAAEEIGGLRLAHEGYLELLTAVAAGRG